MKKSNIFAYIELSKLVEELRVATNSGKLKERLIAKAAYFNIIEPRYFSDATVDEWEAIQSLIKQKGVKMDEDGRIVLNEVSNTIYHFSENECNSLASKVYFIFEKVKEEFR